MLEYSAATPPVFYRNDRTYRKPGLVLLLLVLLFFAAVAAYAGIRDGISGHSWFPEACAAAVSLGIVGRGVYVMVRNPRDIVEIRADGIQQAAEWWTWAQVTRVQFIRADCSSAGHVAIDVRSPSAGQGLTNLPRRLVILAGNRKISATEYRRLAAEMKQFLAENYPHVQVKDFEACAW
jgi:hypothetical protein